MVSKLLGDGQKVRGVPGTVRNVVVPSGSPFHFWEDNIHPQKKDREWNTIARADGALAKV